jgi:FkbM family methyltransferase
MAIKLSDHFVSMLKVDRVDPSSIGVILELGSRDGKQAVEFAEAFPRASVFAFECNPDTLPLVRENTRLHPRITCVPVAVNDFDGEVEFYKIDRERTETPHADGNPGASSLFRATGTYPFEKYVQVPVKVPCRTLDSACDQLGIGRVDLMWIDLQGAELRALAGFSKRLSQTRYLHVELTHREIYAGQPLFGEVDAFLHANGFERLMEPNGNAFFEDCIYRNKAFFKADNDRVVLAQPWGGLGDNLQFSTLPELYARENIGFYLSTANKYRNTEILSAVWAGNPYVKGILNEPATIGAITNEAHLGGYRIDIPFISRIEMAHGFKPSGRFPVVYDIPKLREELLGKTLVDLSSVSEQGSRESLLRFLQATLAWYKLKQEDLIQVRFANYSTEKGLDFSDIPVVSVASLAEYASVLYSVSLMITVHSGAQSLAVAVRGLPGARLTKIYCSVPVMQFNCRNYIYEDVQYYTL